MARIDDYKESFRLAALELKKSNLTDLAKASEVDIAASDNGVVGLKLSFLGTPIIVQVGESVDVVRDGQEGEVPLPEKILICHYLLHATGKPATGELITFRQIPDGHFYFDAFQRRARDPFLATFGKDADLFRTCAQRLGGFPVETGDVGMAFQVFPRIALQIVLWEGDEEFEPEASILFDSAIQNELAVEDIAVVSGMVVYRLMGIARGLQAAAIFK